MKKSVVVIVIVLICCMSLMTSLAFAQDPDINGAYGREQNNSVEIISPSYNTVYTDAILLSLRANNGTSFRTGLFLSNQVAIAEDEYRQEVSISAEKVTFQEALDLGKNIIYNTEIINAKDEINYVNNQIDDLKEGKYVIVVEVYEEEGSIKNVVNKTFEVKTPIKIEAMEIQPAEVNISQAREVRTNFFQNIFRSFFGE